MAKEHKVDYVFAEPSGIVVPFELRNAISSAGRDASLGVGPVVMLLNAADPSTPFGDQLAHLTGQQVAQADLVVLTKSDSAAGEGIESLEVAARELAPDTPLFAVSLTSREGLEGLVEAVLSPRERT